MNTERKPVTHELKTWPSYFQAILDGRKTFEVRVADRDFQEGDTLLLREYKPTERSYTGRTSKQQITYLMDNPAFTLRGQVILGITPISPSPEGYDPLCFHECPECNTRCNCSDQPCSHCKVEVTDEEITKAADTKFPTDNENTALGQTFAVKQQYGFEVGARWMRDLLTKGKEEQK